tara:strand:+ start:12107 stop:12298 length:192 start_codon:yes stop_codon:yes gene_type:complete
MSTNSSKEPIEHTLIPPALSRFSAVGRSQVSLSSPQILRAVIDIQQDAIPNALKDDIVDFDPA